MPAKHIHISPNKPLFICLVDPQGDHFDFELRQGTYETTTGDLIALPRPAVIALFNSGAKPQEEIVITQHWDGRAGSDREWTVALSTRSELARADTEEPSELADQLKASLESTRPRRSPIEAPKPIRKAKEQQQPRLFDQRGTGTHGPAPVELPTLAPAIKRFVARHERPGQIPANIAVREILAFIAADPNTRNWSDQARQDLASTVIIAAYKAGQVGLWERGE